MEVAMKPNAKEELQKEDALLKALSDVCKSHPGVGDAWHRFFSGYVARNMEVEGLSGTDFDDTLRKEVKILTAMRDSITGSTDGANFWRDSVKDDIDATNSLI
jgi:hypothetical protein